MTLHLLGFVAPAIFVGLLVSLAGRLLPSRSALRWWWQAAVNALGGIAVLLAGLWFFGVDGKMATYAALVGAVACLQWLCSRAWRG